MDVTKTWPEDIFPLQPVSRVTLRGSSLGSAPQSRAEHCEGSIVGWPGRRCLLVQRAGLLLLLQACCAAPHQAFLYSTPPGVCRWGAWC
jgi:hypothetical protein